MATTDYGQRTTDSDTGTLLITDKGDSGWVRETRIINIKTVQGTETGDDGTGY